MNADQDITVSLGYLVTQNVEANSTITGDSDLNVAILEDPTVENAVEDGQDNVTVGSLVAIHETAVEGVLCVR